MVTIKFQTLKKFKNSMFFILVGISLVFVLVNFNVKLQNTLTKKTYDTLDQMSSVLSKSFNSKLNDQILSISAATDYFSEHGLAVDNSFNVLNMLKISGSFDSVGYVSTDGKCTTITGEIIDVSDEEYFIKALEGEVSVSDVFTSKVANKPCFVICSPIVQNNQIIGTVQGMYTLESANKLFLSSFYEDEYYGYLVAGNGDIILKSETTKSLSYAKNIFEFFEKAEFSDDYSYEKLLSDFTAHESSAFQVEYEGHKRYGCIRPLGINGWYALSFATEDLLNRDVNTYLVIVVSLAVQIAVIILVSALYVYWQVIQSQKKIKLLNTRHQVLLNNMANGIMTYRDGVSLAEIAPDFVNTGFATLTGYTLSDLKNLQDGRFINLIYYLDLDYVEKEFSQFENTILKPLQYRIVKRDGSIIWVLDTGYKFIDIDGVEKLQSTLTDITELKETELAFKVSEERFRIALLHINDNLFDDMLEADLTNDVVLSKELSTELANECLLETDSYSQFIAMHAKRAVHPEHIKDYTQIFSSNHLLTLLDSGLQSIEFECRIKVIGNTYSWVKLSICFYYSEASGTVRLIAYLKNIDAEKKHLERLMLKSQTDSLTKLFNKTSTQELVVRKIKDFPSSTHAFILIDIDNFKGINDALGHIYGDEVLTNVSRKLAQLFRSTDIIGRIGGDEFVVFLPNISDTNSVISKAEAIKKVFMDNYTGDDKDYKVSCSMGIAFSKSKDTFKSLYKKADVALYKAKNLGKDNYQIFYDEE